MSALDRQHSRLRLTGRTFMLALVMQAPSRFMPRCGTWARNARSARSPTRTTSTPRCLRSPLRPHEDPSIDAVHSVGDGDNVSLPRQQRISAVLTAPARLRAWKDRAGPASEDDARPLQLAPADRGAPARRGWREHTEERSHCSAPDAAHPWRPQQRSRARAVTALQDPEPPPTRHIDLETYQPRHGARDRGIRERAGRRGVRPAPAHGVHLGAAVPGLRLPDRWLPGGGAGDLVFQVGPWSPAATP